MPDNNTSHKKCVNKHTPSAPEGSTGGEVMARKKARVGNTTKQGLTDKLSKARGMQNDTVSKPHT